MNFKFSPALNINNQLTEWEPDVHIPARTYDKHTNTYQYNTRSMVFYGLSESGKTLALCAILSEISHRYPDVFVYTAGNGDKLNKIVPPSRIRYIRSDSDVLAMEEELRFIYDRNMNIRKMQDKGEMLDVDYRTLIILDDMVSVGALKANPLKKFKGVNEITTTIQTVGRHGRIQLVILTQYIYALAPIVRQNAKYHVFSHQFAKDFDYCYAMSMVRCKKDRFAIIHDEATEDRGFLIVDVLKAISSKKNIVDPWKQWIYKYNAYGKRHRMLGAPELWLEDNEVPERIKKKAKKECTARRMLPRGDLLTAGIMELD